jgi:DHA2 family multidrug resistance protein
MPGRLEASDPHAIAVGEWGLHRWRAGHWFHGEHLGRLGWWWVVAPTVGPTLGGWITDNYSWDWVFLINVPVGLLSLSLT